jgi:branched-chain amino acid transport system ATP-binding protein
MSLLVIKNLTHHFGGLKAVSDFNIDLQDNEVVGLIGPNGAGKTTLFNLVCGLYRPTSGEINFKGTSLLRKYPHKITSLGIGRTFQNIRLWNELSVLDNLRIAHFSQFNYKIVDSLFFSHKLQQDERKVTHTAMELLEKFGLLNSAKELPRNLPYGLQRRVEITRALVMNPRLLLLDEPAAGMNQREIVDLMDLVRWIIKEFKVTVWIIEHQMRVIMNICDRITVLDFGETIAEGTPHQIQNNAKVIEAYLGEEVI